MSYRQIETSREIRLWIGQVFVPAVAVGIAVMSNPNTRNWVIEKKERMVSAVKSKFND
jgi:hypothetical protein